MKEETIINIGRDTASRLLRSAIETASTNDQLSNQVNIAYRAGVHIAATHAFNAMKQHMIPLDEALAQIMKDIRDETKYLQSSDMELVEYDEGIL